MANNLLISKRLLKPGLLSGFLFLVLYACEISPAHTRVGTDFCLIDSTMEKSMPSESARNTFLSSICLDSSGHYLHAQFSDQQLVWIASVHLHNDYRKVAGTIGNRADTVWHKAALPDSEGLALALTQAGIHRVTYLLPQQRTPNLLQLDAIFESPDAATTYLSTHPLPEFIAICD